MENTIYLLKSKDKTKKAVSKCAYDFLLSLAQKRLNIKTKPRLTCESNGKPFFEDYPDFHFNVSHSEDLIAVAVSKRPVGVDIEILRDVNLEIAERFFSKKETRTTQTSRDFLYVWTRKEALLKKTGEGLKDISKAQVLKNIEIKTFEENEFILSVCSNNPDSFKIIYEENF
jgi:4'-phosphopantetheinyl transferase